MVAAYFNKLLIDTNYSNNMDQHYAFLVISDMHYFGCSLPRLVRSKTVVENIFKFKRLKTLFTQYIAKLYMRFIGLKTKRIYFIY